MPRTVHGLLACLLCVSTVPGIAASSPAQVSSEAAPDHSLGIRIVLDDVRNFVRAYQRLDASPDTLRILREDYLDRGTPGLVAFQEKFPFTVDDLNEAIRTNPADYDGLAQRLAWLESIQ